jgi:hypothetical protein
MGEDDCVIPWWGVTNRKMIQMRVRSFPIKIPLALLPDTQQDPFTGKRENIKIVTFTAVFVESGLLLNRGKEIGIEGLRSF